MTRLERFAWSNLPLSIQETFRASQLAEDPAKMDFGPTRSVSIGELLVWASYYPVSFAAHVVETLNPDGCAAYGRSFRRRLNNVKVKSKEMMVGRLDEYVTESLVVFLECDALCKHRLPKFIRMSKKHKVTLNQAEQTNAPLVEGDRGRGRVAGPKQVTMMMGWGGAGGASCNAGGGTGNQTELNAKLVGSISG